MGAADAAVESGEVGGGVEGFGGGGGDGEEFGEVEDLHAVVGGFGADVGVGTDYFDVSPDSVGGLCGETANVFEGTAFEDLDEGSAVGLAGEGEFTAVVGCPA